MNNIGSFSSPAPEKPFYGQGRVNYEFVQVVSGQLEGTMFDVSAAKALEKEEDDILQGKSPRAGGEKDSARDAAQAARTASRVLQSLPSKVPPPLSHTHTHTNTHTRGPAPCARGVVTSS